MKRVFLLIPLVLSVIFVSGCADNSVNEIKAINTTQNYGGGNTTVRHIMAAEMADSQMNGNTIEVLGWSANKTSTDTYNVNLDYKENGVQKTYQFQTNINTGKVIGLNDLAKNIITTVQTNNPNLP